MQYMHSWKNDKGTLSKGIESENGATRCYTPMCVSDEKSVSIGKTKYFATFIDDSSRWCEIRFLKSKHEVFEHFKEFKQLIENQKGRKVKCLQCYNGSEYTSKDFDKYLKEHDIIRRLSISHNPEQNGVTEQRNHTVLDSVRCLLAQSGPPSF